MPSGAGDIEFDFKFNECKFIFYSMKIFSWRIFDIDAVSNNSIYKLIKYLVS